MNTQDRNWSYSERSSLTKEEEMDRKIVVALVGRKIIDVLRGFATEHRQALNILGTNPEEFEEYLLDVAAEAIAAIKQYNKGK